MKKPQTARTSTPAPLHHTLDTTELASVVGGVRVEIGDGNPGSRFEDVTILETDGAWNRI